MNTPPGVVVVGIDGRNDVGLLMIVVFQSAGNAAGLLVIFE